MGFHFDYYYPTKENPEFIVTSIDGGYKFHLADGEAFSIDTQTVHMLQAATGHQGKAGEAVEHFRDFIRGLRK